MRLRETMQLLGALTILLLAFLYMRARDKLVDLEAQKRKDKLNKNIRDKREVANEAEKNYSDALKRFNDLLKQYRSRGGNS